MTLLQSIHDRAKSNPKRIVLPESTDERTLEAAEIALATGLAKIVLIGKESEIMAMARQRNFNHIAQAQIIDPSDLPKRDEYIELMVRLRSNKGMDASLAEQLLHNPLYLSVVMIRNGDADGEVAGAMNATGDVLKPAFQFVKTRPGVSVVSGAFIMIVPDQNLGSGGIFVFADCAVNPEPTAGELAEIAVTTASTARTIAGLEPRVAMLSFSTKGSAAHGAADKVITALALAKEMDPKLMIDGELQADAAIIPSIGSKKAPNSPIAGKANVLVFPTLDAGNIAYKLVQRIAKAEAIGPILQGMAAPINDLSRGCSVQDIVNMIAITANQAQDSGATKN
jgi:phosphate acetyltransferase